MQSLSKLSNLSCTRGTGARWLLEMLAYRCSLGWPKNVRFDRYPVLDAFPEVNQKARAGKESLIA